MPGFLGVSSSKTLKVGVKLVFLGPQSCVFVGQQSHGLDSVLCLKCVHPLLWPLQHQAELWSSVPWRNIQQKQTIKLQCEWRCSTGAGGKSKHLSASFLIHSEDVTHQGICFSRRHKTGRQVALLQPAPFGFSTVWNVSSAVSTAAAVTLCFWTRWHLETACFCSFFAFM